MKAKYNNLLISAFICKNFLSNTVVLSMGLSSFAAAQSISLNFGSERSSSAVTEAGKTTGALPMAGNRWNNTTTSSGTLSSLIDSNGNATAGSVTWTSQNTWQSGSTGATATSENGDLTKGYLDDSGTGWTVTMRSPYLLNNIYAIHASDQSNPTNLSTISVNGVFVKGNGTATVAATGSVDSWSATTWTNANTLSESANYLRVNGQPQISLVGLNSSPGRSALSGIQIENAYTGTLAYWDADDATTGAGGDAPSGLWSSTNTNWSTSAAGDVATGTWTAGNAAVFSAGANATGTYVVLVQGTQSSDAIWAKDGVVTLGDGGSSSALALTGTALLRGDSGLTISIPVSATNLTTAGTIALNNANNSVSGLATIYGTTTLGANHSFGSLAGGGTLAFAARTLNVGSDNTDSTYAGLLTGTGSFNKTGSGSLTLLNNVSGFTGTTTVSGGVLRVGGGGGTGSIGGTLTGSGVVEFFRNDTASIAVANTFTGSGTIRFLGTGVSNQSPYDFSGTTSAFTGNVSIDDSRLRIDSVDFATTAAISVLDGGQAWLQAGVHAENYTINGNGWTETAGQLGAVRFENTANVTGSLTVASASRLVAWNGASGTVSGALLGSGNLEMNFASSTTANGTFTLANASGYLGNLLLSRGTLNVGALGGGLAVNLGTANLSGVVAGATSIAGGVMNLNAGADVPSPSVAGGTINLNTGAALTGALAMPTGTTLGLGGGSVDGALTLGVAGTDAHSITYTSPISVNGDFVASGTQTVTLVNQPPVGGTITLLTYTGTASDPVDSDIANNFVLAGVGASSRSATFTDTGSAITLGVGNIGITWVGADAVNPTFWNSGSSSAENWSGTDTRYYNGDAVTFDDSATGVVVALQSLLTPSAVTFNNSTKNFTVTAAAGTGFTGNMSLTKNGTGAITLGGPASTFTGPVVVNAGLLNLNNGEALGFNSGITINAGGAVNLNGHGPGNQGRNYTWTIAGTGADGIGGVGAIYTTGGDVYGNAGVRNLNLSANAEIGGNNGRFDIGLSGGQYGVIDGAGFTLTKVGTNAMVFRAPASNINYVVNAGRLSFEDFDSASGTNPIVVNNSGSSLGTWGNRSIPNNVTLNEGAQLINVGGGVGTWTGAINAAGAATITADSELIVAGSLTAASTITKTGGNQLTITGSLAGSGSVLNHNAGTIQIGNAGATGSISGFPTINLGNGTLFRNRLTTANNTITSNFNFANNSAELRQHGVLTTDTLTLTGTVGTSTTNGILRTTFGRMVLGSGASSTVNMVAIQGAPASGPGVIEVATGASLTSPWFNIGQDGSNSGILNVTGGTVTAVTGSNGVRIGHWNNNSSSVSSQLNVSAGLFDASAANLTTTIGWDGYGTMTVGGGESTATARINTLRIDGNGDSPTYNDTVTMLPNGVLELGSGGVAGASTNDYVILSGGTIQGLVNSTWSARMDATPATTSFLAANAGVIVTQSGQFTGTGTIEKTGAGILQATGGAFPGTLTSSGGTLHLGSTAWTGTTFELRSSAGGVLQPGTPSTAASVTVNALTFNGGSPTFRANYNGGAFGDRYVVSGVDGFRVDAPTALTVIPGSDLFLFDKIPLIDYNGTIGGTSGFAGLSATAAGNPHYILSLEDDTVNTVVNVVIEGLDSVVWKGSVNGTWDVNTTANWETLSDTQASNFYALDAVRFNEDGAAAPVVTLNGTINPSSVQFDAVADYTLQGDPITGAGTFQKFNTGTVTLLNNNTYTGAVTINGGRVRVGDGGTTGALGGSGNISIGASGTLEINRSDAQTLSRTAVGGGTIRQNGTGNLNLTAPLPTNLVIDSGTVTATGGGWTANRMEGNGLVTINSSGTLIIPAGSAHAFGGDNNTMTESFVINGGTLTLNQEQYFIQLTLNGGTINGTSEIRASNSATAYSVTGTSISTVACRINQVGNANWNVSDVTSSSATDITISGNITSTGALVKTGDGTISITGADNTYSGGTAINGGVLVAASVADVTAAGRIGTGYLAIANDATFRYTGTGTETSARNLWIDTGAQNKTIDVVSETASLTFSGTGGNINKPFTKAGLGTLTLADSIVTDGAVTVAAGRLILTGDNSHTGVNTISGGSLEIGSGGSSGTLGSGAVTNNASLIINRDSAVTVSNAISGTGTLTQSGPGTTTLTGSNDYSGNTLISAGVLEVGAGGTSGTLGSGTVTNNTSLVFNRSDALTAANEISGTGTLTKNAAGTLTLTGSNTYSGATTVAAGTLLANNTSGSATGVSAVSVSAGAVLGGTGSVSGTVSVANTGSIAPGVSIGQLTTGALTLAGTYACDVDATTSDVLAVNGNIDLSGATLAVSGTMTASSYTIATYTGTRTGEFTISPALPAGYEVDYSTPGEINIAKSGYNSWASVNAPTGNANDDFDGDGVSNGVEYVLGGTKDTSDRNKLPQVTSDGANLIFTFTRSKESITPDVAVAVQVNPDLGTWPTSGANFFAVPDAPVANNPGVTVVDNAPADTQTVTLTVPMGADTKKFARLAVTIGAAQ